MKQVAPIFTSAFGPSFRRWGIIDSTIGDDAADLVPSNASSIERDMAALTAYVDQIDPAIVATIWDAWRCPTVLLPWLAWALSVDIWDDAWTEIDKRQAIADSPEYHRRKGTLWAIERLLALDGQPYELTEWFDRVPQGRRGTLSVHIEADLDRIGGILKRIRPLLMTSKPKSRPFFLGSGDVIHGDIVIGGSVLIEEDIDVGPFSFSAESPEGTLVVGVGAIIEETTTIEAGTWP